MIVYINSPTSVEELQTVLKIVNAYRIPVWTVSRGKNLGWVANESDEPGSRDKNL